MSLRILVFLLSLLFSFQFVYSQQFVFRNYSVENGVGQSQVYDLAQDQFGKIWMATQGGGLTVFDGVRFITYTEREGLFNNTVVELYFDDKQLLWIAMKNGLATFDGKNFVNYPLKMERDLRIHTFTPAGKNRFLVGTSRGLLLFEKGQFRDYGEQLKLEVMNVYSILIQENNLYLGTEKGLFISRNAQRIRNMGDKFPVLNNAITSIKIDEEGNFWLGTYGDGLYRMNSKGVKRIDYAGELRGSTVFDTFRDAENRLWVATLNQGVFFVDLTSNKFTQLSENEGLSSKQVRKILQDSEGNFWFGTSGGGVSHFLGQQFVSFDRTDGIKGKLVYAIVEDKSEETLWFGTDKGITKQQNSAFVNYSSENGFLDIQVRSLCFSSFGDLFIGTEGKGVFYTTDGKQFVQVDGLKNLHVKALKEDAEGNLWIATAGTGLFRVNLREKRKSQFKEIEQFTVGDGLLSNRLTALMLDKKNRLWYASEKNGFGCFDAKKGTILRFTSRQGLNNEEITSLSQADNGTIYAGTLGNGLVAWNENEPLKLWEIGLQKGLTSSLVYFVHAVNSTTLLVGSEKGVDLINVGQESAIKVRHFARGDGFNGVETCRNAVFQDSENALWLGTINGVSRFVLDGVQAKKSLPTISITDIKLFYEPLVKTPFKYLLNAWNQPKTLLLPYDQNHLTFEFFGTYLSNPQSVRYRWKLEGFDERWSPPSEDIRIVYSNLNPGSYRFMVAASNELGQWSKPTSVEINIGAPFWKKWWFITLFFLVLSGVIFSVIRWRFHRLTMQAAAENRKLQMERDVLELEQKALRLQMNPHFMFNALTSIQSKIGTGNEKEARFLLAKFSGLMRKILDHSRKSLIPLEEEVKLLESYLFVEQFLNDNSFDYVVLTDEVNEPDFIEIPPMLLQPFVENAVKHGFRQLDKMGRRGKLTVRFIEANKELIVEICDNGIGRKAAAEFSTATNNEKHVSVAMDVTRSRLEKMKAGNRLEIIDLYENGDAKGTKVVVRIPLI
ncbi:MAG: hypothetical protein RL264_2966 [Bacteroidota bacterium]|jgi:ligand-binding sensor domain-containing protein